MKKILLLSVLFLLTINTAFGEVPQTSVPSLKKILNKLNPVVAKVGKLEIKKEELSPIVKKIYPQLQQSIQAGQQIKVDDVIRRIVDSMIMDKIMYLEVTEKKINVSEDEIKESMKNVYQRFQGKENFKKFLKQQNLDEKQFEKKMIADIKVNKLMMSEVYNKVSVDEKEAKEFYDKNKKMFKVTGQIKASHILIKYKKSDGEQKKKEALEKIHKIQKELDKGKDFGELAKKYSEGPSSKKEGDLGYFGKGQMVPAFEKAAFALKKGEVSDVVESPFGFHLIKLTDRKPETTLKFSDIKQQLIQRLKSIKAEVAVKKYYENLLKKYSVKTFL